MKKAIEVINSLISIHNDRIEGYETASKEIEEVELKNMFEQNISTSQKCKQELVMEVNALDDQEAEGAIASGEVFRLWTDVKSAFTGKDRKAILKSCEYVEDVALDIYDKVLDDELEHISLDQQAKIIAQKSILKADHDQVKELCDVLDA